MRCAGIKNSFRFKFKSSVNSLLKLAIFGLILKNQLVGKLMFNAYLARCDELLPVTF